MRGWALAAMAAVLLWAPGAMAHDSKRTDQCGCHHQWGLRHCHPKKKTKKCEAPAGDRETTDGKEPVKTKYVIPAPIEL